MFSRGPICLCVCECVTHIKRTSAGWWRRSGGRGHRVRAAVKGGGPPGRPRGYARATHITVLHVAHALRHVVSRSTSSHHRRVRSRLRCHRHLLDSVVGRSLSENHEWFFSRDIFFLGFPFRALSRRVVINNIVHSGGIIHSFFNRSSPLRKSTLERGPVSFSLLSIVVFEPKYRLLSIYKVPIYFFVA